MSFRFYKSEYNPTGLTGLVGGDITVDELSGYLGELFAYQYAYPSEVTGAVVQYRKIFVKNTYVVVSYDTRLWFDAQHVSGQMAVALQTGGPGTGAVNSTPSGLSGWSYPENYTGGFRLGDLSDNATAAVWLRQTLVNIETPSPYTSLRIYVGGIVE
jgi:hypothetical protein